MTAPALTASALDALARLDDGVATAGDRLLADRHDVDLSAQHHRRDVRVDAWQADQCVIGGCPGGPECDSHYADWDRWIDRTVDL